MNFSLIAPKSEEENIHNLKMLRNYKLLKQK